MTRVVARSPPRKLNRAATPSAFGASTRCTFILLAFKPAPPSEHEARTTWPGLGQRDNFKSAGSSSTLTNGSDRQPFPFYRTNRRGGEAMTGKNQHVVPHEGKWAVKGEGSERATSVHDSQAEAAERARDIARRQRSELLVHGRDGEIRSRDSFGHDPNPPKG
jgi:hypothetical protein